MNLLQEREDLTTQVSDLTEKQQQLLATLKAREDRIQILDDLVLCDIYIPQQDDPLDVAIAEFINNCEGREKIKLLFLKRKDGEYQFGKKKLTLMLNEEGQVLVKLDKYHIFPIKDFVDKF